MIPPDTESRQILYRNEHVSTFVNLTKQTIQGVYKHMTKKRDYQNRYYSTRHNQIPIIAELNGMQVPRSLNSFFDPPANTKVDQSWLHPTPIAVTSFRDPNRPLDLTMRPEPVKVRDNKMPFLRSKYYADKDYK